MGQYHNLNIPGRFAIIVADVNVISDCCVNACVNGIRFEIRTFWSRRTIVIATRIYQIATFSNQVYESIPRAKLWRGELTYGLVEYVCFPV